MYGHYIAPVKVCDIQFYRSLKQVILLIQYIFHQPFVGVVSKGFDKSAKAENVISGIQ